MLGPSPFGKLMSKRLSNKYLVEVASNFSTNLNAIQGWGRGDFPRNLLWAVYLNREIFNYVAKYFFGTNCRSKEEGKIESTCILNILLLS